ncbi:MAG: ATP-binding domain-containing protein, partial [Oscillospiraceae bacterium]|nr:ATP-binding domain-containing protein [Oscillospiraceae bacterium]
TGCGEEAGPEDYLAHVALYTGGDREQKGDRVKLMTVHAAKGLEFPYVFLCGLNEGVFPSKKVDSLAAMEEERRLAFVAMTRAERRLFLSESEGFGLRDGAPRYPSRFLLDIATPLLEYTHPPKASLLKAAKDYIEVSSAALPENLDGRLLPAGARVRHIVFGPGAIESVDRVRGAYLVRFDDIPTPRAISFKAKLQTEKA